MNEQQQAEAVALLRLWLERLEYSDPHFDKPRVMALLASLDLPRQLKR